MIHRFNLNGKPRCGATPDKFGHLRISLTGANAAVTCPDCIDKPPNLQAQLAALEAAAKRYRES